MTASIALPQPHNDWLAKLRTIALGLGGRGVMGLGLGRSAVSAAAVPWWLAGGVAAGNAVAVYQPKGAASLAASYVNLANPGTYDAAPGVAPTWASGTGWTFNGSSQYLTTGVLGTSAISLIIRFSDASGGLITFGAAIEIGGPAKYILWRPRSNGNDRVIFLGTGEVRVVGGALVSGAYGYAGTTVYYNSISDGTLASPTLPSLAIFIGALNFNGIPTQYGAIKVQAVAIYSATLTAPQVAAVSAAMAAL